MRTLLLRTLLKCKSITATTSDATVITRDVCSVKPGSLTSLRHDGPGDVTVLGSAVATSNFDVRTEGSGNVAILDGNFKRLSTRMIG